MTTRIYVLTEPDGKIRYVGKTARSIKIRLWCHLQRLRAGDKSHRSNWIRSIISNGFSPKIELVGEVEGDGCREEIAWIKYFREEGVDLVNTTDGGEGALGRIVSKETREKIADWQSGRPKPWLVGKHHSVEHCRKIAESGKGEKNHFYGKHHSEGTLKKLAEASMGNKRGLGHQWSQASREKIRIGVKAYFQRQRERAVA